MQRRAGGDGEQQTRRQRTSQPLPDMLPCLNPLSCRPAPLPLQSQTEGCAVAGGFCAVSYATVDRKWDYQMQGLLEIGRTTFVIVILLVR